MDIFTDYANWKFENYELIHTLVEKKSKIISRFTQVIAVVDFLYDNKVEKKQTLEDFEEIIFDQGFNYIHDQFLTISNILSSIFQNNIDEMDKYAKTINLLLYINDFQNELLNATDDYSKDMKQLDDLEQKVMKSLEAKKDVPDEYFGLLDDLTYSMFERHNIEYNSIEQIFYDIAIEYDIYKENDFDVFNTIWNKEIEKHKN